jgi:hypothetical protein
VHASTTPRRAGQKPYVFTTTGGIRPPGFPPGTVGCGGAVAVHYVFRGHAVATVVVPVQSNCSFSAQVRFAKLIKHHARNLHVVVRFRGNQYLAPAMARTQTIRLG